MTANTLVSPQADTENEVTGSAVQTAEGSAAATPPAPAAPPAPAPAENPCPQCGAHIDERKSSWCKKCGYYPKLGRFVELDQPAPVEVVAPKKSLVAAVGQIPPWGWRMIIGVVGLLVISITACILTPADSSARTIWSLTQLAAGFSLLCGAHIGCYFFAIMENDQLNMLDIILKPLQIWGYSIKDLPRSFRRVAVGLWGVTAMSFAILIVGGIPYAALLDWGGKPAPRTNLVAAIAEKAGGKGDNGRNLEESMQDFAGKAGVDDLKGKEKEIVRKQKAECLILGYLPAGEDDFAGLLVASVSDGRLAYVGVVREGFSSEVRSQLNRRMREIPAASSFVRCPFEANWVLPVLVCRVKFKDWAANRRLNKPLFDELLAEVDRDAK